METCSGYKGKACLNKGSKMCIKCDDGCYPGKAPAVCIVKEVYYDHCKKMIIHVVDLDGVKRTYEVTPMDLLDEIKDTSADDADMPRDAINLKNEDGDILVGDDASLEKLKIENDDTLYMFYRARS